MKVWHLAVLVLPVCTQSPGERPILTDAPAGPRITFNGIGEVKVGEEFPVQVSITPILQAGETLQIALHSGKDGEQFQKIATQDAPQGKTYFTVTLDEVGRYKLKAETSGAVELVDESEFFTVTAPTGEYGSLSFDKEGYEVEEGELFSLTLSAKDEEDNPVQGTVTLELKGESDLTVTKGMLRAWNVYTPELTADTDAEGKVEFKDLFVRENLGGSGELRAALTARDSKLEGVSSITVNPSGKTLTSADKSRDNNDILDLIFSWLLPQNTEVEVHFVDPEMEEEENPVYKVNMATRGRNMNANIDRSLGEKCYDTAVMVNEKRAFYEYINGSGPEPEKC